jgi:hypothetical protein
MLFYVDDTALYDNKELQTNIQLLEILLKSKFLGKVASFYCGDNIFLVYYSLRSFLLVASWFQNELAGDK